MYPVITSYVLKYMKIYSPILELLEDGFQGLWKKVADEVDVQCNTNIESIERNNGIIISTDRGYFEYDYLILACPLDETLSFIDGSDEEKQLFSRIRYYDYHVYAAFAEGLPRARYACVPGRQNDAHKGRTMFWSRRWRDSDLCIFYSLGRSSVGMTESMDHELIRDNIQEDVRNVRGKIRGFYTDRVWKSFPHVSSEDIANGYYDKLEALQGQRNTFYAGELLNFSTLETVTRYSKSIIERFFSPVVSAVADNSKKVTR